MSNHELFDAITPEAIVPVLALAGSVVGAALFAGDEEERLFAQSQAFVWCVNELCDKHESGEITTELIRRLRPLAEAAESHLDRAYDAWRASKAMCGPASDALDDVSAAIIAVLHDRHPKRVLKCDIAGDSGYSLKAVRPAVESLGDRGMIDCGPLGSRKGVALTVKGVDLAQQIVAAKR